jgi:MtN3 and saliva related transmembrane protein
LLDGEYGGCEVTVSLSLSFIFANTVNQAELLGYVAAACTTFSFVPQLIKISKQGGEDLSYGMLGIYLIGQILWLLYGVVLHSRPVIFANVFSIMLVGGAIVMKGKTAKPVAID